MALLDVQSAVNPKFSLLHVKQWHTGTIATVRGVALLDVQSVVNPKFGVLHVKQWHTGTIGRDQLGTTPILGSQCYGVAALSTLE